MNLQLRQDLAATDPEPDKVTKMHKFGKKASAC